MGSDTQDTVTYQQKYQKQRKAPKKGRQYYEGNKRRLQNMARD